MVKISLGAGRGNGKSDVTAEAAPSCEDHEAAAVAHRKSFCPPLATPDAKGMLSSAGEQDYRAQLLRQRSESKEDSLFHFFFPSFKGICFERQDPTVK